MSSPVAQQKPPTGGAKTPWLSVVIPAHNESASIAQAIGAIRRYAAGRNFPAEIVVVDDGSRDDTAARAAACGDDAVPVRIFRNERNQGKGFTVRRGMLDAAGELRLFCDADMSTPIEQLDLLLPWIDRGFDVVIGSRKLADSVLRPPQAVTRRTIGNTFRIIRSLIMLRDIRDTQCGFKLFTRAAANAVFSEQKVRGPAFDCEILALAKAMNYRIKEVGVLWRNNPDSRIHPLRDGLDMLISLLRIRLRMMAIRRRTRRAAPATRSLEQSR